jgi:hypothetical protein
MRRISPPKETLGKAVLKGLGYGAFTGLAVTADAGNPLVNAIVGAGVGAVATATHNITQQVKYGNAAVRYDKRANEVRNRHSALNSNQFGK